jgi:glycosyltransferase involved in cell wall biosynthesis
MNSSDSKLPKISIVMPSFNTVNYIERAIRSVVEQDYPNLELYIKDGGSTDGTLDIIKYYSKKYPKLIKWISSKDKGQTDAINIGMSKVSGEILSYLNSDDVYKKGALKTVGEFFLKKPEVMWAYGKCDIIDGNDHEIRRLITAYKNMWLQNYSYKTLLILNYISQMACFWRREAAKAVGEFDLKQHYVMDYDYWLRLGEKYPAGVINKYLASFRVVPTTKSSMGFVRQFEDEFKVAKKHTKRSFILALHKSHNRLIIIIYEILKAMSTNIEKARI